MVVASWIVPLQSLVRDGLTAYPAFFFAVLTSPFMAFVAFRVALPALVCGIARSLAVALSGYRLQSLARVAGGAMAGVALALLFYGLPERGNPDLADLLAFFLPVGAAAGAGDALIFWQLMLSRSVSPLAATAD